MRLHEIIKGVREREKRHGLALSHFSLKKWGEVQEPGKEDEPEPSSRWLKAGRMWSPRSQVNKEHRGRQNDELCPKLCAQKSLTSFHMEKGHRSQHCVSTEE